MKWKQHYYSLREKYLPRFPDEPHMDSESRRYFYDSLANHQLYIEYGVGGSTLAAAKLNVEKIVSIESDKAWLGIAQRKLKRSRTSSKFNLILAEVGPVASWGTPLERIDGEVLYASPPWEQLSILDRCRPSFILIDGRFRITCFLVSLLNCAKNSQIMFDDYFDRPSYHVIESIILPTRKIGRSAIFDKPSHVNQKKINDLIATYKYDSD